MKTDKETGTLRQKTRKQATSNMSDIKNKNKKETGTSNIRIDKL